MEDLNKLLEYCHDNIGKYFIIMTIYDAKRLVKQVIRRQKCA